MQQKAIEFIKTQEESVARVELPARPHLLDRSRLSETFDRSPCRVTTDLAIPITHKAAGMRLSISHNLSNQFGVSPHPVDLDFLSRINCIRLIFEYGLDNDYLSAKTVNDAISNFDPGSPDQAKACYLAINECLDGVNNQFLPSSQSLLSELSTLNYEHSQTGGWELNFTIETCGADSTFAPSAPPELTSQGWGVTVVAHDILGMPEDIRNVIIQLIHFCCELSLHASSLDMVMDSMTQWMCFGDSFDILESQKKRLIDAYINNDSDLENTIIGMFGDEYDDFSFESPISMAEYFYSEQMAKELSSGLLSLSKSNVATFYARISHDLNIPIWLRSATQLLLDSCHWDLSMSEHVKSISDVSFAHLNPFGLGFPIENSIFSSIHEISMNGEECSELCIPLNKETPRVLANLDLGEKLLLFVDTKLSEILKENE